MVVHIQTWVVKMTLIVIKIQGLNKSPEVPSTRVLGVDDRWRIGEGHLIFRLEKGLPVLRNWISQGILGCCPTSCHVATG